MAVELEEGLRLKCDEIKKKNAARLSIWCSHVHTTELLPISAMMRSFPNKITSQLKGVPSKIAFLCILIYIYLFISSAAEEVALCVCPSFYELESHMCIHEAFEYWKHLKKPETILKEEPFVQSKYKTHAFWKDVDWW